MKLSSKSLFSMLWQLKCCKLTLHRTPVLMNSRDSLVINPCYSKDAFGRKFSCVRGAIKQFETKNPEQISLITLMFSAKTLNIFLCPEPRTVSLISHRLRGTT